ncbi:hypothetical protein N7462_003789 [Penicillium macrosclerotiorum]|uniref:uncharacterized protein n=1 Tax=Penicillium macrosclerotiorum TaxID=303699 RepID=UPI0025469D59|nr:uncharacterized protein N7462_003789 [Penicillium macrosclerotiorum]KAJ5689397.1 hypothetical protein N7462_003789 [Penicillium macrosclerotiorum]
MAPATMKAAICKEAGQPLVIEEVPVPVPTGRALLVRVQVASLCHSDVMIAAGGASLAQLPQILGHEAISVVEELGPDAAAYGVAVGDRIGAPLWQNSCLSCFECRHIGQHFCPSLQMKGVTSAGYFAEYSLVDAATAVRIPADINASPAQLSPIFCAGITVWDALKRAAIAPGETVAVVGIGGLGEIATKYAQALGARVLALDVNDAQLAGVRDGGSADGVLNTRDLKREQIRERLVALNGGRLVDAVVVTSGSGPAYQTAFAILRPEGRLMAVGIPDQPVPMAMGLVATQAFRFVCGALLLWCWRTWTNVLYRIIGAKVAGQAGATRCLEFSQRKGIYPKVNPRKFQLEDINEMMALMEAGEVHDGRMAVQFF